MAIKIDLEKAYDKLDWGFIRERLFSANFPPELIEVIMSCISSVSTSILLNGGKIEPILPSKGIRQDDPLSPYLFILYMDYLGQLIHENCKENCWNPVKTSRSGPTFSHLFFANDLVLFTKANQANCDTMREVLDKFCDQSRQTINVAKSRVYFSPNIGDNIHETLCDTLGF